MKDDDVKHLEWIYLRMAEYLGIDKRYDYMLKFNSIIQEAKEAVIIGEQPVKDNNWIDLCIDNLPERFFTRDDIEIETLSIRGKDNKTNSLEWVKARNLKPDMIYGLLNNMKYRYRIQENKEPTLSEQFYNECGEYSEDHNGNYKYQYVEWLENKILID